MILRLLCLVGLHDWEPLNHGPDLSPYPDMDARECRRCARFDFYAYGSWHRSKRARWGDVRKHQ